MGGLIGKKIGMSQIFTPEGKVIPVTVIQAGPCVITQLKSIEKDGYIATQLGFIEKVSPKRITKGMKGHLDKAGSPTVRKLIELPAIDADKLKIGDKITAADIFTADEIVHIIGTSKGKGFQGVVKRHHFGGGPDTHGSKTHRTPGSIGASSYPSRVYKGQRMGGRMGGERVTMKNIKIISIDKENNLVVVKGSVPGHNGSYLILYKKMRG
ncbi:MAG: 50S ribosomal protein L3 [Candidatus Fischerbacteria bacterium RBG_13_37_8]|uniref:Large ribosomal subunit protein uL3 n=1 Tax=Candidatus Fischerbacteria bacterium RBG_13_37_8 TaxID=1817863 RepID=A0A1F5VFI6_9BACT|nr:MAG: 50S ribosomal protein L3 [Candidatus Fischerbacteria bacterium RBG_13_37_8]